MSTLWHPYVYYWLKHKSGINTKHCLKKTQNTVSRNIDLRQVDQRRMCIRVLTEFQTQVWDWSGCICLQPQTRYETLSILCVGSGWKCVYGVRVFMRLFCWTLQTFRVIVVGLTDRYNMSLSLWCRVLFPTTAYKQWRRSHLPRTDTELKFCWQSHHLNTRLPSSPWSLWTGPSLQFLHALVPISSEMHTHVFVRKQYH